MQITSMDITNDYTELKLLDYYEPLTSFSSLS